MNKQASGSPTLRYFSRTSVLALSFPSSETMILWDEAKDGTVCHVTVSFFPVYRIPAEHPLWECWPSYGAKWDYGFGCLSPKWMGSNLASPEGVFAYFIIKGFASSHDEWRAYSEFSRIRECDWARTFIAEVQQRSASKISVAHRFRRTGYAPRRRAGSAFARRAIGQLTRINAMAVNRPKLAPISCEDARFMIQHRLSAIGLKHLTVLTPDDIDVRLLRITVVEPDGAEFAVLDVDRQNGHVSIVR